MKDKRIPPMNTDGLIFFLFVGHNLFKLFFNRTDVNLLNDLLLHNWYEPLLANEPFTGLFIYRVKNLALCARKWEKNIILKKIFHFEGLWKSRTFTTKCTKDTKKNCKVPRNFSSSRSSWL